MEKYSDEYMKVRQEAYKILIAQFKDTKSVYECANDWVEHGQVTTNGIVNYYKTYFASKSYYKDGDLSNDGSKGVLTDTQPQ